MMKLVEIRFVTTALLMTWLGATLKMLRKSPPPGVTVNQLDSVLRLITVQSKNESEWKLFRSLPGMLSKSVKFCTDQPDGSAASATPSKVSRCSGDPSAMFA